MNCPIPFLVFLAVSLTTWIQVSLAKCTRTRECDRNLGDKLHINGPISGPDYYPQPGPITLTCNVSGDVESIEWHRKSLQPNGGTQILNSKTTTKISSDWIATIDSYLLKEKFPYTYQCRPIGMCCSTETSKIKTVNLRSTHYIYEKCTKDVLIILDVSASVSRGTAEDTFKPFIRRIVDDPRLGVSSEGSNIAIMSFGEDAVMRVQFSQGYNKSVIHKTLQNLTKWILSGARTMTYLALEKANKIFAEHSPLNHRQHVDDVIIFITDGLPTWSRMYSTNYSLSLASSLRGKGVKIVGIAYSGFRTVTNFVRDISTPGEALETTLEDITMIVDRVVDGFCPIPLTVAGKPQNVTVTAVGSSIKVLWLPPKGHEGNIDYYIISWRRSDGTGSLHEKNVTSSPFLIPHSDNLASSTIMIKIYAVNHVGIGAAASLDNVLIPGVLPKPATGGKKSETPTIAVAGGVTGSILFLLAVIVVLFLLKRIRIKRREQSVKEFQSMHERNAMIATTCALPELEPLDKKSGWEAEEISYVALLKDWEISPSCLKLLDKKLGAGQFGIVKQGLYTPSQNSDPEIVALKMLKENARESDLSDLLAELEILKKINKEPHPNVIRFIGGCSLEGKLVVVTELCPGGNLRKFLRKSRVISDTKSSRPNYITSTLSYRQLLKLAIDVAKGMAHLSAQKFVHRDLAARNILLGKDNVAKVSDFGLARDIGSAEEYIRSNQNLLPVKWMALESLLHGRFTTASDVWSFGVLLYEIATLGEEPYKNLSPYNIINHVGSGCRMSKPPHCSSEIYEIMTKCWQFNPKDRPTFPQICQDLQGMLADNEKSYINISQMENEDLETTEEPGNETMGETSMTTVLLNKLCV